MTLAMESMLDQILSHLVESYGPDQVILFGSYAWGAPDQGSDLDLMIIKSTDKRPLDRRIEVRELLKDIERPIGLDLLVLTPQELEHRLRIRDPFYEEIAFSGRKLYERARLSGLS